MAKTTCFDHASGFIVHYMPDEPVRDLSVSHIWFCDLDDYTCPSWQLSAGEHARVMRMKNNLERKRLARRFVFVRKVIENLTGISLNGWEFQHNLRGKPQPVYFSDPKGNTLRLGINISHSENILALAIVLDYNVGIDIEVINYDIDFAAITKTQFGVKSSEWLGMLSPHLAITTFYRIWTRNEALAKMNGSGITTPDLDTTGFQSLYSFEFTIGRKHIVGALALGIAGATTLQAD